MKIPKHIKYIKMLAPMRGHIHEAVGQLFSVEYTDGTKAFVYEETFFHQVKWYKDERKWTALIGTPINIEEAYWDYTPPQHPIWE
jgi:hypothetical protein